MTIRKPIVIVAGQTQELPAGDTIEGGGGSAVLTDADLGVTVQAYDVDTPTVSASQLEMETGTEVALRSMSPLRVAQAIASLGGGGVSIASVRAVSTFRI